MSAAGRYLQVGDEALTDYNGNGLTLVRITERLEGQQCQGGILFRVTGLLKGGASDSLYSCDWFRAAPSQSDLL